MAAGDDRVLVGPGTADDAAVYRLDGTALIATIDFITPVCDDPRRFGRVAAANALSDVFAMGGQPLFALNVCCFPAKDIPDGVLKDILAGAAEVVGSAGAVVVGGHSVNDDELKFGLAAVGQADPEKLLTNAGAQVGDRLILTKPLGTGVLINAFKLDRLDERGLEPALQQMERLNNTAADLAIEHGVHAATDVTGFALAGHALAMARTSDVGLRLIYNHLPVHPGFFDLVGQGVTTGSTCDNRDNVTANLDIQAELDDTAREILFDPQTSGGLLLVCPADRADALLAALVDFGHTAALIGEVITGPPRLEIV